jgi:hypothetical protein
MRAFRSANDFSSSGNFGGSPVRRPSVFLGEIAGELDLPGEGEHVGIEPHAQQRRRIDLLRLAMRRSLVENLG